jgi:hypothetical protein
MRSRSLPQCAAFPRSDAARRARLDLPSRRRARAPSVSTFTAAVVLLATSGATGRAAAQRHWPDAGVWRTHLTTVAALRDGWIELREVPDPNRPVRPDLDPHQRDELSPVPEHLRVTPDAADRWRVGVERLLAESATPGPAFWSRGADGRVTTPGLAAPGDELGLSIAWTRRDGKVVIDATRTACRRSGSADLTRNDVRVFLRALARAAATARHARGTPAPIDTARPYLPYSVGCQAYADSTPGLPPLPADPRRPAEVLVSLVIDRQGAVEGRSLRIAPAVDAVTESAIRHGLARWHFEPAILGGVPVRQRTHFVLAFTPQPPADDPQAQHPTRAGPVPGNAVGVDYGRVVIRFYPDARADTLFTDRRPSRMSLAPEEVARWLSALPPFWQRAAAWRPPAPYLSVVAGPGIGPPWARLHAQGRWVQNRIGLELMVGSGRPDDRFPNCPVSPGQSYGWEEVRVLTTRLARAATTALAGPTPVLDTVGVHPEVAVDCAAAPSDSNVARVALPGGDGDHDQVLLRFVVDRHGSVEPASITALDAPSPAAARAAARLAAGWDYIPATLAGRPVRQWTHATVRVVAPGEARAPRPYPSRAAVLAARDGCEMTRGPMAADYSEGDWPGYHRAFAPSVEFRCEIAPSLAPYRIVLAADSGGWFSEMRVFAGARARPQQTLDARTESIAVPGTTVFQARDLDGDGYRT